MCVQNQIQHGQQPLKRLMSLKLHCYRPDISVGLLISTPTLTFALNSPLFSSRRPQNLIQPFLLRVNNVGDHGQPGRAGAAQRGFASEEKGCKHDPGNRETLPLLWSGSFFNYAWAEMEGLPPTGQAWWKKTHPEGARQNLRPVSIPARLAGGSGTTTTTTVFVN